MISQLASAAPVSLSIEDRRIAMGARSPDQLAQEWTSYVRTDAHAINAAMRVGDRADYAKILALVDAGPARTEE